MKKLITAGVILAAVGVITIGGCGAAAGQLWRGIINDKPEEFTRYFPVVRWCGRGIPLVDKLDQMLNDKVYIVLLQNNAELRSTGGFMGSYAKLKFSGGGLKSMEIKDIYEPDGLLPGHVEPPYPIQEAFGQGWWKLRDSNWDVEFASAAATIDWFFEHGGEPQVDGMAAVNLDLFKKWIGILGSIKPETYDKEVTADNLYQLAQAEAETRLAGGRTNKREFLGAVGTALVERTKQAGWPELIKLGRLVYGELKSKQIMVWVKDEEAAAILKKFRWDGRLRRGAGEYLYVVESNLGANKANCCIKRQAELHIIKGEKKMNNQLRLTWENLGQNQVWSGKYVDYVRLVIPAEDEIKKISVDGKELQPAGEEEFANFNSLRQGLSLDKYVVEKRGEFKVAGWWTEVLIGQTAVTEVEYEAYRVDDLHIERQPGIDKWPVKVSVGERLIYDGEITGPADFVIK
jgi:hypothetical protein